MVKSSSEKPTLTVKDRFQSLRYLPPFFKEIWLTQPKMTLLNIFLRLIRSTIPFSTLYVGKLIIDEVLRLINQHSTDTQHLIVLVAVELGLTLFSDVLNRGTMLLDSLLGDLYATRSSLQIMRHAATLDLAQFEDPAFYDKLERARQQTVGRTALLSQTLLQAQDLVTVIFLAGGLVAFNPWLIVLLGISIIPAFLGETYFNAKSYSLTYSWTPQRRELDYYRLVGASNSFAKEVKLWNLSDFLAERYQELAQQYYQENKKLSLLRAFWITLLTALGTVGYYAAYGYIGLQTAAGAISIGSLTFLAGSFRQLRSSLENILSRFNSISQGALYLKDLFDFFDIQPTIVISTQALPFPTDLKEGFRFENVGFKYPNTDKWALRHLNFTLKLGEKLALVGENGAGKTTIVKLLTRLYDPTEGRILLEGRDLRDYDPQALQGNIGVIFQDFIKLFFSAQVNIAVGDIPDLENLPRIETASKQSLADSVLQKLPNGLQQVLGRHFKDGVDLSGGEWQKIALARAYMRDSQLLILDEPTAALDARAEHEVFQRFTELTKGKMALLISHRFSTVRMADRILVIENGQPQEEGSHEELLAKNGRYAELFHLQAKGYL